MSACSWAIISSVTIIWCQIRSAGTFTLVEASTRNELPVASATPRWKRRSTSAASYASPRSTKFGFLGDQPVQPLEGVLGDAFRGERGDLSLKDRTSLIQRLGLSDSDLRYVGGSPIRPDDQLVVPQLLERLADGRAAQAVARAEDVLVDGLVRADHAGDDVTPCALSRPRSTSSLYWSSRIPLDVSVYSKYIFAVRFGQGRPADGVAESRQHCRSAPGVCGERLEGRPPPVAEPRTACALTAHSRSRRPRRREPPMKLAVLHGSNLNRLGKRNPAKYGHATLADITADIDKTASALGVGVAHLQSNSEATLIEFVHDYQDEWDGIVINPAGFSSAGYPLLDALRDTGLPYAVIHISQWHAIDAKERIDIFAGTATVYVAGAGWRGYSMALDAIVHKIRGD